MKKIAIILCNDMHMDIEKANVLVNYISKNNNYIIVTDYKEADVIIIYTCAFGSNKMYSIRVIADIMCNALETSTVIVTGCLTKICSNELKKIPNIIVMSFKELLNCLSQEAIVPLVNMIPQNKVVISDGCLHKCSYCVYPLLVDKYKSKTIEQILYEVEKLYSTESTIYITGAHETSDYGIDLYGKRSFSILIEKIVTKFPNCNYVIGWFNISGLTDDVISVIGKYKNITGIMLHIQHVNEEILKAMNRPTFKDTDEKIQKLRAIRKDLQLFTEVIVGFPGESEAKFQELVDYLSKGYFSDIGVASYEAVLGTKASLLENQVPKDIKNSRMNYIKEKFLATCYPADEHSSESITNEYNFAYEALSKMPRNILCNPQKYNKIAGIDTRAKMEDFEYHLNIALQCVISSRSEFDIAKNKKFLEGRYTFEARKLFCAVIQNGDFKPGIKERAKELFRIWQKK